MNPEEQKKLIGEITKELLNKLDFPDAQISVNPEPSPATEDEEEAINSFSVEINVTDSKYLIGKFGVNLSALQHILRLLVRSKITEGKINFSVDVNDYRKEQRQALFDHAHEVAQKVIQENTSMALRPMNAFERRLIHTELAKVEGIATESAGEGFERKVIIKPTV